MTTPEAWAQSSDLKLMAHDNDGKIPIVYSDNGEVRMVVLLTCANCGRATTTGLCGCPSPQPTKSGSRA